MVLTLLCAVLVSFLFDKLAEQHCLPALRANCNLCISWQCKDAPHALIAAKSGLEMLKLVCHVKGMQGSVIAHFTMCYYTVQAHPPPVEVGTETDGELQEVQAALEAQRSQAHALKRRILELQVTTVLCLLIV